MYFTATATVYFTARTLPIELNRIVFLGTIPESRVLHDRHPEPVEGLPALGTLSPSRVVFFTTGILFLAQVRAERACATDCVKGRENL